MGFGTHNLRGRTDLVQSTDVHLERKIAFSMLEILDSPHAVQINSQNTACERQLRGYDTLKC